MLQVVLLESVAWNKVSGLPLKTSVHSLSSYENRGSSVGEWSKTYLHACVGQCQVQLGSHLVSLGN